MDYRKMKVYVDPACKKLYCSFYIQGLRDLFGKRNVKFKSEYFKALHYDLDNHLVPFVVDGKKYVIDSCDSSGLFYEEFLKWADVYGKVNYREDKLPVRYRDKIKRVGPNFGIACYGKNKWTATAHCVWDYIRSGRRHEFSFRHFLSPYLWLYKRAKMDFSYQQPAVGSKTIFMVSRYWKGQDWVNSARINFIRACRRLQDEGLITFTGGMVPDTEGTDCPGDVMLNHEIPFGEYMDKMKNSLLVFNTPAYHHCHGWKLPEYLSQGKIILSTPFVNELPADMVHGENIYFTDEDEESIYNAVKEIVGSPELQKRLSDGSLSYWNEYLRPLKCILNFLGL